MRKQFTAALLAVACMMCGCSGSRTEQTTEAVTEPTTAAVEVREITVGVVLPLSGTYQATGKKLRSAMETAEDLVNHAHDSSWELAARAGLADGSRLRLVFADSESTVQGAAVAANHLLMRGVSMMLGGYASDLTAAVAERCALYGVPMICGSSSAQALTDGTSYALNGCLFRVAATDVDEAEMLFDYLDQATAVEESTDGAAPQKTIAIAWRNNLYGQSARDLTVSLAAARGYQVVADYGYGEEQEFDPFATLMTEAMPTAIFHASYQEDLTAFAKAYDDAEYQPQYALCYSGGFEDSAFAAAVKKRDMNGFYGAQSCFTAQTRNHELFSYFNDLYRAQSGANLDGNSLLEMASVLLAAQALDAAQSVERADLLGVLRTETFDAPYLHTKTIRFDANGQNLQPPLFMTQLVDGEYKSTT